MLVNGEFRMLTKEQNNTIRALIESRDECMQRLVGAIEQQDKDKKQSAVDELTVATRNLYKFLNSLTVDLNAYMRNNHRSETAWQVKRLECNDGFSMSVQAGESLYSSPRRDNAFHYDKVEVGFPSAKPLFFAEYAENTEDYTETVYGYVPVELVEQEIAAHGGIKTAEKVSARDAIIQHAEETLFKEDNNGAPGTFGYFSMRD
jgi:hypothetical protein